MVVAATEKRSKAVRFCKNLWISLHSAHWWNYSFFWTNNLIKMHSENTKWKDLNKSLWHLTLFAHLRHIWSLYLTSDKCHQDNGHQEIQTLACKIYFYWGGVWLVGWLLKKTCWVTSSVMVIMIGHHVMEVMQTGIQHTVMSRRHTHYYRCIFKRSVMWGTWRSPFVTLYYMDHVLKHNIHSQKGHIRQKKKCCNTIRTDEEF